MDFPPQIEDRSLFSRTLPSGLQKLRLSSCTSKGLEPLAPIAPNLQLIWPDFGRVADKRDKSVQQLIKDLVEVAKSLENSIQAHLLFYDPIRLQFPAATSPSWGSSSSKPTDNAPNSVERQEPRRVASSVYSRSVNHETASTYCKAYEDHSWIYYEHVNQAFADKIVKSYKRGDIIWIHSAFEDPPSVSAKSLSDIRIRIKVLHNFSRMRRFQPYSAVVEAVKASEVLELTEDEEVRRKVPLDEKFGNSYDDTNLDSLIFKNTHGRGGHTRPPHRRTVNRRPPWSLATARFKAFRRK
ncbi:hypothetical protein SLS54_010444 [Diplodia seriata]